jgi:CO dehydrogenase nickel-insertion accessory protein CooC1
MSVVTFWSNGKEQTGKTMSIAAIATYMAIEHNKRILVISTANKKDALENCFWETKKSRKLIGLFTSKNNYMDTQNGIDGLVKLMKSNKISSDIITNYTKIVFKDRLEILLGSKTIEDKSTYYPDIIKMANQFYDLVFVDLDNSINEFSRSQILKDSNLIIANVNQRLASIDEFNEACEEVEYLESNKVLVLIGRYDKYSKYNSKNITRYLGRKKEILTIPYNTLYFEATEEAGVPDMFLKFRNLTDSEDRNGFFIQEVKRASEAIIYKLQDLQMGM